MIKRPLFIIACVMLTGIASATAANHNDDPKKARYHYVCSGSNPGFSFLPFLGLKRISPDSAVVKEVRPTRLPEDQCEEVILSPFVF